MLVCPSCSLSNPESNLTCMGCGRELPPDASLGTSLSEMAKWYSPAEEDAEESETSAIGVPVTTTNQTSTGNTSGGAVVEVSSSSNAKEHTSGVKEHTGRFSLVVPDEQDSDVLGDMEEALYHLLEDSGVGQADDDAEVMIRFPYHLDHAQPPSTRTPGSAGRSDNLVARDPVPKAPEEFPDPDTAAHPTRPAFLAENPAPFPKTGAMDTTPQTKIEAIAEYVSSRETTSTSVSDPVLPPELLEKSSSSRGEEKTTIHPFGMGEWKPAEPQIAPLVPSAPPPAPEIEKTSTEVPSVRMVPSTASREQEATLHGSQPPQIPGLFTSQDAASQLVLATSDEGDEATKIQRNTTSGVQISLQRDEPTPHRPAPTDRIDLRELQSLLVHPQTDKDSDWDVDTARDNVLHESEPDEILELDAESLVDDDWHDTPHPMSSSLLSADPSDSSEELNANDPMEHTLSHLYARRVADKKQEVNAVTSATSVVTDDSGMSTQQVVSSPSHYTAPQAEVGASVSAPVSSSAQRWITPNLGPFASDESGETSQPEHSWGAEQQHPQTSHPVTTQNTSANGSSMEPERVSFVRTHENRMLTEPALVLSHGAEKEGWAESSAGVYVVWQLDVESIQSDVLLRQGQRLHILKGLSEVLVGALHDLGLEVCTAQEEWVIASYDLARGGMQRAVQGCLFLLRDVIQRHEPPLMARLRGRCVVVTMPQVSPPMLEEATLTAQRLLRGMPVDRIWLSWSSHQAWQDPQSCVEVVLPSLEEPAYEIDDSHLWPGEQEVAAESAISIPWVGQEHALATLHHLWRQTQQGTATQALILGEPGSGRSRLLEVWQQQIHHAGLFFVGGLAWCSLQTSESPYLASLLYSHVQFLGLKPIASLAERVRELSQHLGDALALDTREVVHALLELLTEAGGSQKQQAQAVEWLIRASAVNTPVLLVFDDLFLLDPGSLGVIQNLLRQLPSRFMVVVVSSPGEYEDILFSSLPDAVRIEVAPLHPQESYQLVTSVWPESGQHREQVARLIEQSEGNPRILLSLLQQHIHPQTRMRERTWSHQPSLPQHLEASLLRRLRQLTSLEQDTLRKAAVIGDRFWKGCIEALERLDIRDGHWGLQDGVVISHVDDRSECLTQLQQKGLIEPVAICSIVGEQEYRFQHRLLRNLCMRQLPTSVRQRMHRWVAQWLQVRDREQTLIPERAHHLKLSGQPEESARQILYAAQNALIWGRCRHALSLLSENIEEGDRQSPLLQLQSYYVAGEIYEQMGDFNAAQRLYESARQRSWQLTDPLWGARTFLKVAECEAWKGQVAAASGSARNARTLAQQAQEDSLLQDAHVALTRFALMEGQVAHAYEHIKQLQVRLSEGGDPLPRAQYLAVLGWMYRSEGRWADSVQKLQEAIQLFQDTEQPLSQTATLIQLGDFFIAVGDDASASPLLEQAVALSRPQEAYGLLVQALGHLAHIALRRRNVQQAQSLLQEAWQHVRISGDACLIAPIAAAMSAVSILVRQSKDALRYARMASHKIQDISAPARARTYHFLGEAASGMPPHYAQQIFEQPPSPLPEGGIITYCYLKAVEMFKHVGDAANQLTSLLALTRALFVCGFARTSAHILERGINDARQLGLGLLLEQMSNQQRLIQGGNQVELEDASIPAHHSTMVVRQKKQQSPVAFPGAVAPGNAPSGVPAAGASALDKSSDRWQDSVSAEEKRIQDRKTHIISGSRQGHEAGMAHPPVPVRPLTSIPRPSSPPPKKK